MNENIFYSEIKKAIPVEKLYPVTEAFCICIEAAAKAGKRITEDERNAYLKARAKLRGV